MSKIRTIIPKCPRELELFYREVAKKLAGTDVTLEEVDQRSNWPGAAITGDIERSISSITSATVKTMAAKISELEREINGLKNNRGTFAAEIAELNRKITSLQDSARY